MSLWESVVGDAAAALQSGGGSGGGSPRSPASSGDRPGSRDSGSARRSRRRQPAAAVEGNLDRWSESRQCFVRRWFALRLGADGQPPSLEYTFRDDGGDGEAGGATPRSILKVSSRPTSPENGSIAVGEIRGVRLGFDSPSAMGSTEPEREFQLTCVRPGSKDRTLVPLRAATKADCQMWISALGVARGSAWRKHQAEAALPPGWKAATDRRGRTYYYEKTSGTRSWKHPTTGRPGPQVDTPANEQLLHLSVELEGFFGVMFEEEVDPSTHRVYVRVTSIAEDSLASQALPGLQPGWLLHSAQGRAAGYLGTAGVAALLKERPLHVIFADGHTLVDSSAEEEVEVRSLMESRSRPELSSAAVRVLRKEGVGSGERIHINKREWTAKLVEMFEAVDAEAARVNARVDALLALRQTSQETWGAMATWDAASVLQWTEMAALPKDEQEVLLPGIRQAFEAGDW